MTLEHACLNAHRCQPGDDPRITETPNTLCDPCIHRAAYRITQLPTQHLYLHAMLGERTTSAAPVHTQPDSTVLINVAIDTLLNAIHHHATLAAELVADQLNTNNPYRHNPTLHIYGCCRLVAPNLHRLLPLTDVDIMEWSPDGTHRVVTLTTGVAVTQHLEHLSAMAHYTLGMTRERSYRDIPCARCASITVGRWAGANNWDCETCGAQFPEADIRRHDRILLERHRRGLLNA